MTLTEQLERFLAPLKRRVQLMVAKAVVTAVKDDKGLQVLQLSLGNGELKGSMERVQNFGFTSHPLTDAETIALFVGGNRDHGVVIAVDDSRYRVKMDKGETAVYNANGDTIKLLKDGTIEVSAKKDVKINAAGKVEVNGATGIELKGVPAGVPVGVVNQLSVCAFTGGPHPMGSTNVKATP